jgi:hypothetical protein
VDSRYGLFLKHGKLMTADQIRTSIASNFRVYFKMNLTFSQYRHAAVSFSRHIGIERHQNLKSIFAEQTGHSEQTSDMVYGLTADAVKLLNVTTLNSFLKVSYLWHEWLGVGNINCLNNGKTLFMLLIKRSAFDNFISV